MSKFISLVFFGCTELQNPPSSDNNQWLWWRMEWRMEWSNNLIESAVESASMVEWEFGLRFLEL